MPLCESRGGMYVVNIVETGSPKTTLELLMGLNACCTEVAILKGVSDHTVDCSVSADVVVVVSKRCADEAFVCAESS